MLPTFLSRPEDAAEERRLAVGGILGVVGGRVVSPRLPSFVFSLAPVVGEGQSVQEDAESSGDERSESRVEAEREDSQVFEG